MSLADSLHSYPDTLDKRQHIDGVFQGSLDKMENAKRDGMGKAFTAEECTLIYRALTEVGSFIHIRNRR
jgi:hypothetical protein